MGIGCLESIKKASHWLDHHKHGLGLHSRMSKNLLVGCIKNDSTMYQLNFHQFLGVNFSPRCRKANPIMHILLSSDVIIYANETCLEGYSVLIS